jgi:hypothetical protein
MPPRYFQGAWLMRPGAHKLRVAAVGPFGRWRHMRATRSRRIARGYVSICGLLVASSWWLFLLPRVIWLKISRESVAKRRELVSHFDTLRLLPRLLAGGRAWAFRVVAAIAPLLSRPNALHSGGGIMDWEIRVACAKRPLFGRQTRYKNSGIGEMRQFSLGTMGMIVGDGEVAA